MGLAGQTLIILDGRNLAYQLHADIAAAHREYVISDSLESFYDWMIMEGFRQAIAISIRQHFSIDRLERDHLYRAIFDAVGPLIVSVVRDFIRANELTFLSHHHVKMIVTFQDIVIVKSF